MSVSTSILDHEGPEAARQRVLSPYAVQLTICIVCQRRLIEPDVPEPAFGLSVFPNPARESSTLVFLLDRPADVRLSAYDVLGREVARLADGVLDAGRHEVVFDASALPSGIYLLRMAAQSENEGTVRTFTQRITLLR